jgi:hypothetical protein
MQYWDNLFGHVDWGKIGSKYRERLITPKDFMPHFKNILHRALFTRNRCKVRVASGAILCRLCHREVERITHLATCRCTRPLWDKFRSLHKIKTTDNQSHLKLTLLGYTTPELPTSISDFHLILWKFIIIHFTLVDLENRPFKPDEIWIGAIRRYLSKIHSLQQKIRLEVAEAQALERPINVRRFNALLAPLATIDEFGRLRWSPELAPHAASLCPDSGDLC